MGLFRRKQHPDDVVADDAADAADDAAHDGADNSAASAQRASQYSGPFDSEAIEDERERIDFGSILVPAVQGMQIRVELDEAEEVAAVSVLLDETVLQLQAFAAPRSEGLWDEIRQEIAEGIRAGQGRAREAAGAFGRELRAEVTVTAPDGSTQTQDVRFIGADGPRWFVRGLISGAGATDDAQARAVEEIFGSVAVRRGEHAAPPREPLPLSVPDSPNLIPEQSDAAQGTGSPTDAQ